MLNFYVGEKKLFGVTTPGLILEAHYGRLGTDLLHPKPPFERLNQDVGVIVTRSHPVKENLPLVTRMTEALRYVPLHYHRYHVDLRLNIDTYKQKFSAKSRSTLQRKIRKFTEHAGGVLDWQVYRSESEMQDFYHLARAISAKTYQERLLDAGLPDSAEFQKQLGEWASTGQVRGYLLRCRDQPVAYILCPVRDGVVYYEFVGYDSALQALSPGTVLQYLALESLFDEQQFDIFDFTEGEGQHKAFFATHSTQCADVYYFRPGMRAWGLVLGHAALNWLTRFVVAGIDRLGMKARIKKLLRH